MTKKQLFLHDKFFLILLALAAAAGVVLFDAQPACAQVYDEADTLTESDVFFYKGDVIILKVYSLTQIAVTKPGIVDIINVDVNEITLVGKAIGETTFFIWDEHGKRTVIVHVLEQNLEIIQKRIERLLETIGIKTVRIVKNNYEGKLILQGRVTKDKKEEFDALVKNYSQYFIDTTKESGELILVDVQVTELSESLSKAFGFDWSYNPQSYQEAIPTFDGSPGDWFKIGDFSRTSGSAISVQVHALVAEGKGRVLSKPRVVVEDGQSTSMQVGGEIPVPTTTATSGGTVQENIQYRSYGVNLNVTPEINGDKIDVNLNVSISDIDAANAAGGNVAFTNTSTNTKVSLDNGQTMVIAGLIKNNTSESYSRVPFLSNIPVLGALFRYTSKPDADKEVVISLTPHVLSWEEAEGAQAMQEQGETDLDKILNEEIEFDAEDDAQEEQVESQDAGEDVFNEDVSLEENPLGAEEETSGTIDENFQEEQEDAEVSEEETAQDTEVMAEDEGASSETLEEEDVLPKANLSEEKIEEELLPAAAESKEPQVNISQAITQYVQALQKKISNAISFPLEAKQQGWEGTVKLTLVVLSDGMLSQAYVKESSGHKIFDEDALNTAQLSMPFDPFPAELDLEELTVTVPIMYSQEAVLDVAP